MAVINFALATGMGEMPGYDGADFTKMLAVWGNGNADKGFALFNSVTARLVHARAKHPVFAEGAYHALGVINSEHEELVQAVEHESPQRQKDEALDVIATAIRFVGEEHFCQ